MNVTVPFVEGLLHRRVVPALERAQVPYRLLALPLDDPHAYRRELEAIFGGMVEPTVIVEQDVEIRTGVLEGFGACERPWCFHAYPFKIPYEEAVGPDHGFAPFGCTRFRPELRPILRHIGADPDWLACEDHNGLDRALSKYLNQRGYWPHRHDGEVFHHHDYSAAT